LCGDRLVQRNIGVTEVEVRRFGLDAEIEMQSF
jgi:hypothetical protein